MQTDLESEYGSEKQELYIRMLLSNDEIFTRCRTILDKSYFNPKFQRTVDFMLTYAEEYRSIPKPEVIKGALGKDFPNVPNITTQDKEWFLDDIEKFCRHQAVANNIMAAPDKIARGEYEEVEEKLKDALLISLTRDLGSNFFTDFQSSLIEMQENNGTMSTGYSAVDRILYGGLNRGELTIFLARSGGGKSLMMQNIALNWATMGLHVVYISLELSEALINKRLGSMYTGVTQKEIMRKMENTALMIGKKYKENKTSITATRGSLLSKQMKQGSTCNDVRSYIKEYEIKFGYPPDALVIDYLDLLYPNNKKINPSDLFVKDKFVSEEMRGLAQETRMLCISASQVNREGMNELEFDFTHIAGGVSKINTSDNVIGLLMTDAMRARGEMQLQFLKTRSSGGVGSKIFLAFNNETLRIEDKEEGAEVIEHSPVSSEDVLDKLRRRPGSSQPNIQPAVPAKSSISAGMTLRETILKGKN